MNSNNENFSDHHRSAPRIGTALQNETVNSIYNKENNDTCLFTITPSSTSFINDSIGTSAVPQTGSTVIVEEISIFNVRTNLQRKLILSSLAMIAFLLPFCDTIYLPAINAIRDDLNTSDTLVALTVSIYLFMNGLSSLLWGPVSDRFGRKITIILSLTIFVVVTLACIFAPTIIALIVFRAIEGGTVSATLVVGQGIVADIYPEEERGWAAGLFFLPFNIGPVIGPLIGGPLSDAFGWRSTFIFLTIFSFLILVATIALVPETHQYFVKERFHKLNPTKRVIDAMPNEILPFQKPWKPFTYLTDSTIAPYIAVATTLFATLYTSFVFFSIYLHQNPYNYTTTIIGVLFVPSGAAFLTGSLLGGWLSDKVSAYYGHERCPEGRLVPGLVFSILTPICLITYGWTFHYKLHVAGPIFSIILLSLSQAIFEPTVSSYLTIKKPKEAAAVCAANTSLNFCLGGVIVGIGVPLENAIGTGPYFSLMAGINVVTITLASILVYKCIRRASHVVGQQNGTIIEPKNPV